jgi:hypothetical protein
MVSLIFFFLPDDFKRTCVSMGKFDLGKGYPHDFPSWGNKHRPKTDMGGISRLAKHCTMRKDTPGTWMNSG